MPSGVSRDDLTARARIREAAFALIAEQGVRGTTLRAVGERAGVSPALVLHHYGSKQGVVDAVSEWVLDLLSSATGDRGASDDPAQASSQRAQAFDDLLRTVPLLRPYIRRMLLDDTPESVQWFTSAVEQSADELRRREKAGLARRSDDVLAEAAILSVAALGPILLPRQLGQVLGASAATERWRAGLAEMLSSALYPRRAPTELDGHEGTGENGAKPIRRSR